MRLPTVLHPHALAGRVRGDLQRSVQRTRNGIKHLAGIDHARIGQSEKDTIWRIDKAELWHYRRDTPATIRPPILLVMSLVSRSTVLDLRPGNSMIEFLLEQGFDVYLLDWGVPDEADSGNGLETYVDHYLPRAVARVCAHSGSEDVTMWGYCFGGVLSVLSVAGNPTMPVRSLLVMATPTDFRHMGPMSALLQEGRIGAEELIDDTGNVPAEIIRGSFRVLKPTSDVANLANLFENLWSDDYLGAHQAMDRWANEHIPFPGEAFRQTTRLFAQQNLLAAGQVPIGGRIVDLHDITVPFLNVIAEADHIVPLAAASALTELVGSEDRHEMRIRAGHVGLIVGKSAHRSSLPSMAGWVLAHSDIDLA